MYFGASVSTATLLNHCSRKQSIYKCVLLERKITRIPHLFASWNVSKLPAAENSSWEYTAVLWAWWLVCRTHFPWGGMFDLKRSKIPCKDRVWRWLHSPLQFCHGTWWIPTMCCFMLFCMVTNLRITLSAAFSLYKFRENSSQLKSAGWCTDCWEQAYSSLEGECFSGSLRRMGFKVSWNISK